MKLEQAKQIADERRSHMKGLTLTQPWATLVALGTKRIETRSWRTEYRGPLAIHAAKGFTREDVRLVLQREPFKTTCAEAGYPLFSLLPRGSIVAVCALIACYRVEETPRVEDIARGEHYRIPPQEDTLERAFGDYTPGRYAWILTDIHRLPKPVPCRGALQLWKVPDDIEWTINYMLSPRWTDLEQRIEDASNSLEQ